MDEEDYAEAMSDIHHAVKRSESKIDVEFSAELAIKASTLTDVLRHATTLLAEEKKKGATAAAAAGRMARDLALYRDVSRAHLLNNATAPCSARLSSSPLRSFSPPLLPHRARECRCVPCFRSQRRASSSTTRRIPRSRIRCASASPWT